MCYSKLHFMKKIYLPLLLLVIASNTLHAQFSEFRNSDDAPTNFLLNSNNNTLQIGGRVSAFYGYRFVKDGVTNLSHNNFAMKDVDIDVIGTTRSKFVYEVQFSLLDLVTAATTQNSVPSAPGLKAAYVSYEGNKLPFRVELGYDKLPYSMGSLNDAYNTPMWSHANLVGGDFFSRRDLGLTLTQRLWKNRLSIYGGIYSGLGETIFQYGGDASGRPEYVGRVDLAYPSHFKYDAIDEKGSAVPAFRLGVNARYTDKTQPAGRSITTDVPDALGTYDLSMVNGKKLVYGGDFIFKYKGLSLLFEADYMNVKPADATDPLYEATPITFNGKVVHAGGFVTGANYNWKKAHSVFSINYENINANDLLAGHAEWLYIGYAYKFSGFNSVFKAEFYRPLKEDVASDPLKYNSQIRVGYQIVF